MNYMLFRAINRFAGRSNAIDTIMIFISQKARYLYFFIVAFMWFRNNVYKKIILYAGISVVFTLFINCIMQRFYFKPRPFVLHRVRLLIPSMKNSSFPSKHTALAFALATSISLHKRFIGLTMWVLAFLTGFSRIWVGHHYPFDIIGSAFMGSCMSFLINKYTYVFQPFVTRIITIYSLLTKSVK